jgi:hypothetical protein
MKKLLLLLFLLGTITMMLIMAESGAMLKTAAAPLGIINIELANTTAKTRAIINSWAPTADSDKITAAKFNTYSDFLFLFFYAGFLFFACKKIAVNSIGSVAKAGNIIAYAALLAGFADVMENTGLLFSLNYHISAVVSFCTAFFSTIKWSLVVIAVLYVLTGLLVLAYRRIRY